jgi:hypothetical protein
MLFAVPENQAKIKHLPGPSAPVLTYELSIHRRIVDPVHPIYLRVFADLLLLPHLHGARLYPKSFKMAILGGYSPYASSPI